MTAVLGQASDVYFGSTKAPELSWRSEPHEEIDPDDEELDETPASVIEILGFDPKEFSGEDEATTNQEAALLILNAWSNKARKAALAKRAMQGYKGIPNERLKDRVSKVAKKLAARKKKEAKAEKEFNTPLKPTEVKKRRKEFQKQLDEIRASFKSIRAKLKRKFK